MQKVKLMAHPVVKFHGAPTRSLYRLSVSVSRRQAHRAERGNAVRVPKRGRRLPVHGAELRCVQRSSGG